MHRKSARSCTRTVSLRARLGAAVEVQDGDEVTLKEETYIAIMGRVEGVKLVVTRLYPRGISRVHFDRWLPILAPSQKLLHDWKHSLITWEKYTARFREERPRPPEPEREVSP
ncbi:unnamed protein product [marine sediment metagenome]|uniref:DUF488 domain-containing protein n=1 Tax=marine sediment metagenome TaxID=412755 RepID=X0YNE9_9ZZZZ